MQRKNRANITVSKLQTPLWIGDDMAIPFDNHSTHLYHHLLTLGADMTLPCAERLWQDIAARYSEPQRVYHSLSHIEQLFTAFTHLEHQLQSPAMIALALYYHDIIYAPTRSDNEVKSADYAVRQLRAFLSEAHCRRLHDLIVMTAAHELAGPHDTDAAYLLDMDLGILGSEWTVYKGYADAVRKEYAHVAIADYRVGRRRVLQGLLAKPTLYLTDAYQDLEAPARANISRELELLATA